MVSDDAPPRVAIIAEWLESYAGSEKVLEQILACFPEADLFAVVDVVPDGERDFLGERKIVTSFVQSLPFARKHFRLYLPLIPLAVEQFDVGRYDLVISNSHAFAKGVLTRPDQLHVSYVHTPIRYAWEFQHQYLRESGLDRGPRSWIARWFLHKIRIWDLRTVNGVDVFVCNSNYIARRIAKTYRRKARVVYPPVDTASFPLWREKEDFYLAASRMVPYKRMDLVARAFAAMPDRRLVMIGDGPEIERVRAEAGPNVEFLGYQPLERLRHYMQRARAFVFAAEEDFGILPLEAQACGTPVIAYGKGGATETIVDLGRGGDRATGLLFDRQDSACLVSAVERFERDGRSIRPDVCRENALRFGAERFRSEFMTVVRDALERLKAGEVP